MAIPRTKSTMTSSSNSTMAVGSAMMPTVTSLAPNHDMEDVLRFTLQHYSNLVKLNGRLAALRAHIYGSYPVSGQSVSNDLDLEGLIPRIKDNLNRSHEMISDIFATVEYLENQAGMVLDRGSDD